MLMEKEMSSKFHFLTLSAIHVKYDSVWKLLHSIITFSGSFLNAASFVAYVGKNWTSGDISETSEALAMMLIFITSAFTTICLLTKRRSILAMSEDIRATLLKYEDGLTPEDNNILSNANKEIRIVTGVFYFLLATPPICFHFLKPFFFLFFTKNSYVGSLPFQSWFPFEINTVPVFIAVNVFQMIYTYHTTFSFTTFILFITHSIRLQAAIKILIQHINLLPENTTLKLSKNRIAVQHRDMKNALVDNCSDIQQDYLYSSFVGCIKHHILLLRFYNDLQDTFAVHFLILACMATFIIAVFGLIVMVSFNITTMSFAVTLLVGMIYVLVYCVYSERISTQIEALQEAVYGIEWYNTSPRFKRSLLIMLMNTMKPLRLNGVITTASMKTFAEILKTAYSYFNVLHKFKQVK